MQTKQDLQRHLQRMDGSGYKSYKSLRGAYDFGLFVLHIDHVQGDPFATPSRVHIRLNNDFPDWAFSNKSRAVAFRDYLTRAFDHNISRFSKGRRGSGRSGSITIDRPGQEILERTSVLQDGTELEVRFRVGLPAFGRRIAGREAEAIFLKELPEIVAHSLFFEAINEEKLQTFVQSNEDADALRKLLGTNGLTAFVAEGAILPRASGIDQRPLKDGIPFKAPDSMRHKMELPNRNIEGMGIQKGITLIAGGGYHGKSTLLQALQFGVYNHIPGDGREFVVTQDNAVKIRAEDGRFIEKVNISPFISHLPNNRDTGRFSSDNASGSTSQAANIIEALEAGSQILLIDEDTSASNFMLRDHLMQQLIPKEQEPITPFIDKARQLFEEQGVSSILVLGGSGLYFSIADCVISMLDYIPQDLTEKAKAIAREYKQKRITEGGEAFGKLSMRYPQNESVNAYKGERLRIRTFDNRHIQFGYADIDLSSMEQIVDDSQLRAIAEALLYTKKYMDGYSLQEVLDKVMADISKNALDVLNPQKPGNCALFRKMELAAAINRLRTIKMEVGREND